MRTRDYEQQQRIKEAMVRLILREGINGASVAKIAREAGVSPATIYPARARPTSIYRAHHETRSR